MPCSCSTNDTITIALQDVVQHNSDTFSFDFTSDQAFNWKEGDSSKIFLPVNGDMMGKAFSYVTLPDENVIRFTTRIKEIRSPYKQRLAKLKKGETIAISQPKGHFELRRDGKAAILLSNGVGVATMRSLAKAFDNDPSGVNVMIQINVDSAGCVYEEEFSQLASDNIRFSSYHAFNRKEFYDILDFQAQRIMFATGAMPNFYIVGSDGFIIDASSYLMSVGFTEQDIMTDGFSITGGGGCGCGSSAGGCGCSSGGGCGCGTSYAEVDVSKLEIRNLQSHNLKAKVVSIK